MEPATSSQFSPCYSCLIVVCIAHKHTCSFGKSRANGEEVARVTQRNPIVKSYYAIGFFGASGCRELPNCNQSSDIQQVTSLVVAVPTAPQQLHMPTGQTNIHGQTTRARWIRLPMMRDETHKVT